MAIVTRTHPLLLHLAPVAFILLLSLSARAQMKGVANDVTLRRGEKRVNLQRYNDFGVFYNKKSQGQDSVSVEVYAREIWYKKDTLIVRPYNVNVFRFMDTLRPYNETRAYPPSTNILMRIPVKELESMHAKRQPLYKFTATLITFSYVGLICSPFLFMSTNESVSRAGQTVAMVTAPLLVVSLSCNSAWAKKRFHFDRKKHKSKNWSFSN
ncbi:MAG TPA: hypothetical protein PLQ93_11610 [Bacteroidia bacterium]|nr:hypothetical protein [Bacteroidia bacterium]